MAGNHHSVRRVPLKAANTVICKSHQIGPCGVMLTLSRGGSIVREYGLEAKGKSPE